MEGPGPPGPKTSLSTSFTYELPADRIAQRPCHPYDAAKLLIIDRDARRLSQSTYEGIDQLLTSKDLLVFNDSRVIPARLFGKRNNLDVEFLLLKELERGVWEAIGRPLRKLKANDEITFSHNLSAKVKSRTKDHGILLQFFYSGELASRQEILEIGLMPIPPYIREGKSDSQDKLDYQTNFAKVDGSIAAPTASLHFTENLLGKIQSANVKLAFLTLHVGLSSIKEIEPNSVPGSENFFVSKELIELIESTKRSGGRVIAVGTTVVRALESAARFGIDATERATDLFIKPGFEFQYVDAMVTNFHMPGSTHLLLVEAFLKDRELLQTSYEYAMKKDFRFLSYGDGMIII